MNNSAIQISQETLKDIFSRGLHRDTAVQSLLTALNIDVVQDQEAKDKSLADKLPDFTQPEASDLPPEVASIIEAVKQRFGSDAEVFVTKLESSGIRNLLNRLKQSSSEENKGCSNPDCMNCKINEILSLNEQITASTYLPNSKAFAVDVLAETLVELTAFTEFLLLRESEEVIFKRMDKFEEIYAIAQKIASVQYPDFEEKQDTLLKTLDLVKLKLINFITNI